MQLYNTLLGIVLLYTFVFGKEKGKVWFTSFFLTSVCLRPMHFSITISFFFIIETSKNLNQHVRNANQRSHLWHEWVINQNILLNITLHKTLGYADDLNEAFGQLIYAISKQEGIGSINIICILKFVIRSATSGQELALSINQLISLNFIWFLLGYND